MDPCAREHRIGKLSLGDFSLEQVLSETPFDFQIARLVRSLSRGPLSSVSSPLPRMGGFLARQGARIVSYEDIFFNENFSWYF